MAGYVLRAVQRWLGKSDGGSAFRDSAGMRWSGIRGTPSSDSRSLFTAENSKLRTENFFKYNRVAPRNAATRPSRSIVANPLPQFLALRLHHGR